MKLSNSFITKLACLSLLVSHISVFAWGLTGHRVIAEIAENHLSCKSKRQIKKLLGKEKLAYWANWPDFIKSDTTGVWKEAGAWHYVNIEPSADFKTFETELKNQAGPSLYNQLYVLQNKLKNKNLPENDRKNALIFVIRMQWLFRSSFSSLYSSRTSKLR